MSNHNIVFVKIENIGHAMKNVFRRIWTAKAQISLHIHAVWSGPSLSTNRIIGYYRMLEWRAKTWMILCVCVDGLSLSISTCLKALFHLTWSTLSSKYSFFLEPLVYCCPEAGKRLF